MTISEIKRRTLDTSPHYFSRRTLKFFGQTMRSFSVSKQADGRFKISAPCIIDGKKITDSVRYFNPETNQLEH